MVICLGRGAYLHMAQLMPLSLTISCSCKSRLVLPFCYQLTWVVPYNGPLKGYCCCCCCCCCYSHTSILYIILPLISRASLVLAITTKSSVCNSHGVATLKSLDKATTTITNSSGLYAEPFVHTDLFLKTVTVTINCSFNCFCSY